MTESTLSHTINTLRREVGGVFLGFGRDPTAWTANQLTDVDDVINSGLRRFYFPPMEPGDPRPFYEWSFLRKEGTITLSTSDYDYNATDDFSGTILDTTIAWNSGASQPPLKVVSEDIIRKHLAANATVGIPRYFAARTKTFDPTTGQRWEFLVYPTPSSDVNNYTLTYRYITIPNALTNTNVYPQGGAQHSETILAACMAAGEAKFDDDPDGKWNARFKEMLGSSKRLDDATKSTQGNLGTSPAQS